VSDVVLDLAGVSGGYGRGDIVHGIELEVRAGERIAIVGPNGAGKSTLLALLAGALEPSEGRVEARPGITVGWMPQRPAHYARLSARQNLELFARLERAEDARATAQRLLAEFELPADERPAAALSVGNRQRLDLAIAVLGRPSVLLLDEPTAALDPRQRRRLWDAAARLRDEGGAVVLVTQNVEDLERIADRVAVLLEGELIFDGPLAEYRTSDAAHVFA
jgi:ABC-2 type transport system ATP-binding protein